MSTNYAIQIPEKLYVGFQQDLSTIVPVAMMTPDGTDAAAKKRKAVVDRWGSYGSKQKYNCVTLENKPMTGFRISRSLRKLGWRNTLVTVRLEDPRGFEVEVSVANLIMLTDCNMIHNGEVIQECVWGRNGSENLLLPVNSEPYLQAVENTTRMNESVSLRNVKPGMEIELQKGGKGIYMGNLYQLVKNESNEYSNRSSYRDYKVEEKKRHFIRLLDNDGLIRYKGSTSMKIARITNEASKTPEEIRELINSDFTTGCSVDGGLHYYKTAVSLLRSEDITVKSVDLITITEDDAKKEQEKHWRSMKRAIFGKLQDDSVVILDPGNFTSPPRAHIYGHGYLGSNQYAGREVSDTQALIEKAILKMDAAKPFQNSEFKEYFMVAVTYQSSKEPTDVVVYM